MDVFLELALILIVAKLFGYLSVRLGFPGGALGQLFGGIIIGPPSVLNLVSYDEGVKLVAELGVVLLLFLAGLETDVEEFKRVGGFGVYSRGARCHHSLCTRLPRGPRVGGLLQHRGPLPRWRSHCDQRWPHHQHPHGDEEAENEGGNDYSGRGRHRRRPRHNSPHHPRRHKHQGKRSRHGPPHNPR